jgi:hypothetical protein
VSEVMFAGNFSCLVELLAVTFSETYFQKLLLKFSLLKIIPSFISENYYWNVSEVY